MKNRSKMLIMGIDCTTKFVIEYARTQGIYTIITDYNTLERAPLKRLADEYWMINVGDLDLLEERCRAEQITSVFAGCHEFCLDMAKELCKRLNLPFYASEEGWATGRDKARFKKHCMECGLDVAHGYPLDGFFSPEVLAAVRYPVVVKPSDASAERGLSICHNEAELRRGYENALSFSQNGNIIVEEYVEGNEVDIVYYVDDGIPHLICVNDNLLVKVNERMNMSFIPNQSRYYDEYVREVEAKVEKLIQRMECKNGVVTFQAIRKDGKYYFLEAGNRLDGAGCWVAMKRFYQASYLEWMVDLARGRKPVIDWNAVDFSPVGKHSAIYLYWARPGHVQAVKGRELIEGADGISIAIGRFQPGDTVVKTDNFIQIAWFIQITAESSTELVNKLAFVNQNLLLLDEHGQNLMIPYEDYEYILAYY